MKCIEDMTNEELLRAIDLCEETSTNLTSHGQSDDYLVGSFQMAKRYQMELEKREKSHIEKEKSYEQAHYYR